MSKENYTSAGCGYLFSIVWSPSYSTNFKLPASAEFLAQSGFHFRFQLLRINEDDAKFEIMLDVHSYRPDEIKVKRKIL